MQKDIAQLIGTLGDKDGLKRQEARVALEKIGKSAVPSLITALSDAKESVRWEAAKAFTNLKAPTAAEALVKALRDESFEIQWLAAEALIALKREAIVPLLRALLDHSDSGSLQQGAHHVLHALERAHQLGEPSLQVLNALRTLDPEFSVMAASKNALEALSAQKNG